MAPPSDLPPESKRKPSPSHPELTEVERAISVLQGRHPEHERMRRETEEAKASKTAEQAAARRVFLRAALARRLKIGGVFLVVLCALAVIAKSARRESKRTEALDGAAQPYLAKGFTLVDTSGRGDPTKLEADVEPGCFIATSAKKARLKLAYTGGFTEGEGPLLTCLCDPNKVTMTGERNAEGLVLLRTPANTIGGSRAFYFLPFQVGTLGYSDQNCAEASLDEWIDAKHWLVESIDAKWLDWPNRRPLKHAGFSVVGSVRPDMPFGVIEIPANSCTLLVDESGTAKTSVRLKGGGLAIGPALGTIAWCTSQATTAVAQREGKSELTILSAPAVKVGGLLGVREAAEKSGIRVAAMTVPAADRNWIAKQLLVASAIPESLITLGTEEADKDARIAVLSVEKPGTLVSDSGEGIFSFCDPPLNEATASLCVFSGPQKWRIEGADSVAGIARAKMPFWLFGLQNVGEPAALKRATQMVTLARRLHRDGFEPTSLEAATETDKGVEVLGRANEDAVVAVMLAPSEPWAIPLAEAPEIAWSLDAGDPHEVKLKTLERIVLSAPAKTKLPPKEKRRTVVFRHHI